MPDPTTATTFATAWDAFAAINERRRAIRDFDGTAVSDEDMRAILAAAQLAPSSGNTQPYELHWVKDDATRARVAEACNGQRAARTAGALVVIVSHHRAVGPTADAFNAALQADPNVPAKTKAYYATNMAKLRRAVPFMRWRVLGAVKVLLSTFSTYFELLPIGRAGVSNSTACGRIHVDIRALGGTPSARIGSRATPCSQRRTSCSPPPRAASTPARWRASAL
jgi:nitroreductase